jgi:hypothetical protein
MDDGQMASGIYNCVFTKRFFLARLFLPRATLTFASIAASVVLLGKFGFRNNQ